MKLTVTGMVNCLHNTWVKMAFPPGQTAVLHVHRKSRLAKGLKTPAYLLLMIS